MLCVLDQKRRSHPGAITTKYIRLCTHFDDSHNYLLLRVYSDSFTLFSSSHLGRATAQGAKGVEVLNDK